MKRLPFLGLAALLIVIGVTLRLVRWGLPLRAHHIGGELLWGAMLYMLIAALRPTTWRRPAVILTASAIVVAVEMSRLYHAPALDAFRLTLAGQLLLGHIFSAWNMVVDELGIVAAAAATWRWPALDGAPPPPAHGAQNIGRKASS